MSGKPGKVNPFLKLILDSMKIASPSSFHPCPYIGVESINKLTVPRSFVTLMPAGAFKVNVKVTDGTEFLYGSTYEYEFL
jgi:hypothetical protein